MNQKEKFYEQVEIILWCIYIDRRRYIKLEDFQKSVEFLNIDYKRLIDVIGYLNNKGYIWIIGDKSNALFKLSHKGMNHIFHQWQGK